MYIQWRKVAALQSQFLALTSNGEVQWYEYPPYLFITTANLKCF